MLIGHMGGPLWASKDDGAWSIPKGLYADDEEPLDAAVREFTEEIGLPPPVEFEALTLLGEVRQPSGKLVTIWSAAGDLDLNSVVPGTFTMEWPPRSGRMAEFPEIDRVAWLSIEEARPKLVKGQRPFLDLLTAALGGRS